MNKWKDVSEEYQEKAMKFWDGLVTWNHYDHVQWEFQGYINPKITDIDPDTMTLSAEACILPTVKDDRNEIAIITFDLEKETFRVEILNTEGKNPLIEDPDPEVIIKKLAEYTEKLVKKINYQGGSPIFQRIEEYGINP